MRLIRVRLCLKPRSSAGLDSLYPAGESRGSAQTLHETKPHRLDMRINPAPDRRQWETLKGNDRGRSYRAIETLIVTCKPREDNEDLYVEGVAGVPLPQKERIWYDRPITRQPVMANPAAPCG